MPLREYVKGYYASCIAKKMDDQGQSSYVVSFQCGSEKILVKAVTKMNESLLVLEQKSNELYAYAVEKGKGKGYHIGVPSTRIASDDERMELTKKDDNLKKYSLIMVQEFAPGKTIDSELAVNGRQDWLFGGQTTLRSLGFLAGLDVVFCNADRIPVPPIFSHYGNLNNIMYHTKKDSHMELMAIDNAVRQRMEQADNHHVLKVTELLSSKPNLKLVGETIFKRVLVDKKSVLIQSRDASDFPSFEYTPNQIKFAADNITFGFCDALCMLRNVTNDEDFTKLINAVDGIGEKSLENPGLIQKVLRLFDKIGDTTVSETMRQVFEELASAEKK